MADKLDDLQATISAQIRKEMLDLERLQDEAEERRQSSFKTEASAQQDLLKKLLTLQVEQEVRRQKAFKWASASLGTLISIIGGWLGVTKYTAAAEPDPVETVEKSAKKVEKTAESADKRFQEVDSRLEKHDEIFKRLVDIQLDQQVQSSDSHDHIVNLLKKVDPAATKNVPEPPSVTDGRTRATKIKNKRSPTYDPTDPLGDLIGDEP